MRTYNIIPVEHASGGHPTPDYQRYHLTADELTVIKRLANSSRNGLAPAGMVVNHIQYVDPPTTSRSTGIMGQRALDEEYFYICVATDLWGRVKLDPII